MRTAGNIERRAPGKPGLVSGERNHRGDLAFLNGEEQRFNSMLRRAAGAAGDGYVDTYAPSAEHNACAPAADRWIEPLIPEAAAAALHPNAAGEKGMAGATTGRPRPPIAPSAADEGG
jgi:hypothetical protein